MTKTAQRNEARLNLYYAAASAYHLISASIQTEFERDMNGLIPASLPTVMECLTDNAEIAVNLIRARDAHARLS